MNIYEKLMGIQQELKAPKGNFNNFGKYKYRSAEDILEAVKPLLAKYKTVLLINDEVKSINDTGENKGRYYVEATVTLIDVEKGEKVSSKALAREEESKKGMDGSQVTGGASSYARKYALNGLFAIDDTKDSDYTNTSQNKQQMAGRQPNVPSQQTNALKRATNDLYATVKTCGYSADEVTKLINEKYKKKSSKELTLQEVKNLQEFIKSDYEIAKKETQYQKSLDPKELMLQDEDLMFD